MDKLSIGTAQFGMKYGITNNSGKIPENKVKKILNFAKKKKLNFLDTAIAYGESENILGKIGVASFDIVSKLPEIPPHVSNISNWIDEQISQSLERLCIKKLYACLLHHTQGYSSKDLDKMILALKNVKSKGLVNKIGISIYSPSELEEITTLSEIDIIQAPLNIFDRRLELSGWLNRLYLKNIEIHARSVFLQGLLLSSREKIPKKFEKWSEVWNYWDLINDKKKEAKILNSLHYVNSLEQVSKIIVGIESLEQLSEILDSFKDKNTKLLKNVKINNLDEKLIDPRNWKNL